MTVITDRDVVESVADALQFISYYHPTDFVQAVHRAYEMEQSQAAKDALAQILINSRMSVSYTHLRGPRDLSTSRMPSSA